MAFPIARFTTEIVTGVVLILVYVALLTPLNNALADWNTSDPTFGGIAQSIVPILIGVGILLAFVFAFVPRGRGKMGA